MKIIWKKEFLRKKRGRERGEKINSFKIEREMNGRRATQMAVGYVLFNNQTKEWFSTINSMCFLLISLYLSFSFTFVAPKMNVCSRFWIEEIPKKLYFIHKNGRKDFFFDWKGALSVNDDQFLLNWFVQWQQRRYTTIDYLSALSLSLLFPIRHLFNSIWFIWRQYCHLENKTTTTTNNNNSKIQWTQ